MKRKEASTPAEVLPFAGDRAYGEVVQLDHGRGFGFILDAGGTERFFHATACEPQDCFEQLKIGDSVSFEPRLSEKGPRAMKVRREEPARKRARAGNRK